MIYSIVRSMPGKRADFRRSSLRTRHFIILAIFLSAINLLFFLLYYAAAARALNATSRSALGSKIEAIDKSLRTRIEQYALPAKFVATNAEFQQILTFMQINESDIRTIAGIIDEVDALSKILRTYSGVSDIADLELYLFTTTTPVLRGIADNVYNLGDIDHKTFFLTIRRGQELSLIRKPYTDMGELDDDHVYIARQVYRLYEPTIPFGGVLLTSVSVDRLREILLSNSPTPGSTTFIVDGQGWVQLASDPSLEGKNLFSRFPEVVVREGDIVSFREEFRGQESLVSAIGSLYGWYVAAATPVREAVAALSRLSRILLASLVINLLVSAGMSYELSTGIVAPIEKLVDSIRKVQQGDFSLGIDYNRNDEFAELIQEYNHMLSRVDALLKDLIVAEKEKTTAELTALQAQINPHFLYNTLDTINWMALDHGQGDISEIVTLLSDFFRYSVSRGRQFIPLADEIRQVESYMVIQKKQYPDTFDFVIDFPPECAEAETVKLIIQPLVENSIVHGFRDIDYQGYIEVAVSCRDGVVIDVVDNGRGADADRLNAILDTSVPSRDHFAVRNVHLRIQDRYGDEYGLHYESRRAGGLRARIRLPLVHASEASSC